MKTASSERVLAAETLQKSLDLLAAKGEEEEEEEDLVDARRKGAPTPPSSPTKVSSESSF